jgi:hypothetical protein
VEFGSGINMPMNEQRMVYRTYNRLQFGDALLVA